jgi:hypothetical protein
MRITRARLALLVCLGAGFAASPFGCSAGTTDDEGGEDPTSTTGTNAGGNGGATNTGPTGSTNNQGGGFVTSGGGEGGQGGSIVNPCGTECGPVEKCGGINQGIDDDCDGNVDEDCPCGAGESDSCFKGDPSYLDNPLYPTCAPGTMACTENGTWGPCTGGSHADSLDECFAQSVEACHPINSVPFATVDLLTGTGTFSADAIASSFTVECPAGVDPCPMVSNTDFTALQSGEYTVTYTKTVQGGAMDTCEFPLYVGAKGLRVELSWNWGGSGKDIDFHMHRPQATTPWSVGGNSEDCGYANCKAGSFVPTQQAGAPNWFPPANVPPDPVNWYVAPTFEENLCYYAPQGLGMTWSNAMQGCHSPRLDVDNISCDLSVTDPNSGSFCSPENINIDYPPKNEWIRISAFMFSSSPANGLTPNVKIFCDGAQRAELGQYGFNNPEAPIVWDTTQGRKWWMVADVIFKEDECTQECIVRPLYLNDNEVDKLPLYYTEAQATSQFGQPYAPIP